jgi:exonuclease SbcD
MPRILHFADAHIDMANYGRHDPATGLPLRVLDFLKSLDTIVDTAIEERVDLVLFAGDAFKDRTPPPTYQREWGKRIMRLSNAAIPTLLLVGNHDLSPALGRAHALEAYDTLQVPHVRVLDRPELLGPKQLEGLPLQVVALPWISRSGFLASVGLQGEQRAETYNLLVEGVVDYVKDLIAEADPKLPLVLTAHCSVQGAKYGGERAVMLGGDLVLSGDIVRDKRLDYVALGHIHKAQDLNPGSYPPVIYPGSIERVDFGEARDDKFFVIADVIKGGTRVEWRQITGVRPFLDCHLKLGSPDHIFETIQRALPAPRKFPDAILRLVLEYPREWEAAIDEAGLREYTAACFEFHLVKRPTVEARVRLPNDGSISGISHLELLDVYLRSTHTDAAAAETLAKLAAELMHDELLAD